MSDSDDGSGIISTIEFSSRELELLALTGIATTSITFQIAPSLEGVAGSALALIMLAIVVTDFRLQKIPDRLTIAAAAVGIIAIASERSDDFVGRLIDASIRSGSMVAVVLALRIGHRWFRGLEGIGIGDAKLVGVGGLWLQTRSIFIAIVFAGWLGLTFAMIQMRRSGSRRYPFVGVPYGSFLASTIWLLWLFERS